MKVLHFADCCELSWMTPWIAHMKALDRLGVEQELLCRPGGSMSRIAREHGITVRTWKALIPSMPSLARGYAGVVAASAPDIIHTRLASAALIAGHWRDAAGVPLVSTFNRPAAARPYSRADRCISCSEWTKARMVDSAGMSPKRIDVIYNGIDVDRYARDEDARRKFRDAHDVAEGERIIAGMGVFTQRKAFDVLIRAFARVCHAYSDRPLRLMLIGGWGEIGRREEYLAIARELGVRDRLIMPDAFVNDVRTWLWSSDIFVMPARDEGLGIALIEARASGLPSVVSNVGPMTEITRDGDTGLVARVDDVESFADAINIMLGMDESELAAMTARALEQLRDRFDLAETARRTLEVYERVLRDFGPEPKE